MLPHLFNISVDILKFHGYVWNGVFNDHSVLEYGCCSFVKTMLANIEIITELPKKVYLTS